MRSSVITKISGTTGKDLVEESRVCRVLGFTVEKAK